MKRLQGKRIFLLASLLLATALVAEPAFATSLLFNLSPTTNVTTRGAGDGPGQGVSVSSTVTISQFAMNLNMPNGGNIEYMIWNGDNSTLLYSQTLAVAPSNFLSFVMSNPFTYTLNAGNTYWFGVMGNNNIDVGYIFPRISYSANGLTAVNTGNSNYSDFAAPTFNGYAGADIGLRLYSGAISPVPEPPTLLLFAMGLIGLAGLHRRHKRGRRAAQRHGGFAAGDRVR